ncbi:endoplasmic reticulum membrane sensor NFE2L1a isoform X2 [Brachionichthys hirsutus]|uniref:endoplasmic reticulum membrane sensor NFE2L1a isoform X2 n=1 Tax=Brachionichthys hirsutus TaxID=412623 RepID=UPI003604501C
MQYLKKCFMEGLIQMAILLSLCGLRLDVGLPPSWPEMILGSTSALTQAPFHNHLEDGHSLHPKNVDLEGFFTARRLLGWVHSLDRLQVPHAELETWLVQLDPDPVPSGLPDQTLPVWRGPAGEERDQTVESRSAPGTLQEEDDETGENSFSLHECLRLLEETAPSRELLQHVGDAGRVMECQSTDSDGMLPPVTTTGNPSLDLELKWQDLMAVMDMDVDMSSFDRMQSSAPNETFGSVGPETSQQSCSNIDDESKEAEPDVALMEHLPECGFLGPFSQPEAEPHLFALTPSAELDDHSSACNTMDIVINSDRNPSYSPRDHTELPGDFLRPDAEVGNWMTRDLPTTPPSSVFLFDEQDAAEDEDRLPSPLDDLFDDASILDEIRLLDLALEEGFSPEMEARLDEEDYLYHGRDQQETGNADDDLSGSIMATMEDQAQPRQRNTTGENEADSDSGLSLDFSNSHASPCASEASFYSSSPSCISTEESTFSEDDDDDAEEGLVTSDIEAAATIKQEQLDEEELGAVGGGYTELKKLLPSCYKDEKLLNGFPCLEHVSHDHSYNQPRETSSSSALGKMSSKPTKSSLRHINAKPYHPSSSRRISDTKLWSRDQRRARALQVPFSNERIVNLPMEEFNDLLASSQLSEEQLTLVRDIRRRGKNKIAAQNCRMKKMEVLVILNNDVSRLMRYRSRLLRKKQEAMRHLQEMKQKLGVMYQEVFSRLRDEEGRPLDAMDYLLHFEPSGSVMVAPRQQGPALPLAKPSKKQRNRK